MSPQALPPRVMGSSPHTRGARRRNRRPDRGCRIIPAYAGSTSRRSPARSSRRDHPRIRGEHTELVSAHISVGGSSPHTRGARSSPTSHRSDGRIIPAYAGSTGDMAAQAAVPGDHPRIRGEHQCAGIRLGERSGSSPHTRGAPRRVHGVAVGPGIIPAYAGSTPRCTKGRSSKRDHPRIRGEHIKGLWDGIKSGGSSPHTRGARPRILGFLFRKRIIPAYAGSTPTGPSSKSPARDHPRIRGEHLPRDFQGARRGGSSPHTRGAPTGLGSALTLGGIIPAYAGSTSPPSVCCPAFGDHPRIRGEHPPLPDPVPDTVGSSPHTRGALEERQLGYRRRRIIPAYAGSTRGLSAAMPTHLGSSPHTRGARLGCRRLRHRRGIIPAYAGSTPTAC